MIYWQLFLAFLQIGAFSFGGGYASLALIQEQVIDRYGWLTTSDFTDLITIAEMTPGPIAVNAATFVGIQIAGTAGAVIATLGVILPSCIIVTLLSYFYRKYRSMAAMQSVLKSLRPAVVALILAAGLKILIPTLFESGVINMAANNFQVRAAVLFVAALVALQKFKIGSIKVMVGCGFAELLIQIIIRGIS